MFLILTDILIILILLILSAFFSSSETALTTISPHRLRTLVEEGYRHAALLEKILSQREKMLSVILICNNIVNLAASALTTVFVQKIIGNWAVSIGTGVLTILVLVFGEIAPKTAATYRAEKLALKFSPIIYFLMIIFTPLAAAVNVLAAGVLKILSVRKSDKAETYTENEIRSIVDVSTEEGVLESGEKEIINNVFDFTDTVAREVMVPRVNITAVHEDSDYQEIRSIFTDNYYTRLPVYNPEDTAFVGMLNTKDLMFLDPEQIRRFQVADYLRPLPYTFEQKHLSELFMEMKKNRQSMMAVMDEYGDTVGIVTMEDLLEELVGEIRDEYDADEENNLVQTAPDTYEINGSMNLSDINDRLGTDLESDAYDSVGGLLMEKLDRIPEEGDTVRIGNVELTVEKMDGTRLELVKLTRVGRMQETVS